MEAKKLCEIVIPTPYILNDNAQNTYRTNMGKYTWLEKQIHMSFDGGFGINPWCMCWTKPIDECSFINKKNVFLLLGHYHANETKFDYLNYERCYKPLIDGLTGRGYFEDDNYKIVSMAAFTGGGPTQWKERHPFEINTEESKTDLKEYILDMGARERIETTKYKKITNYDLFQIHVVI